jgi:hypothetical protein
MEVSQVQVVTHRGKPPPELALLMLPYMVKWHWSKNG